MLQQQTVEVPARCRQTSEEDQAHRDTWFVVLLPPNLVKPARWLWCIQRQIEYLLAQAKSQRIASAIMCHTEIWLHVIMKLASMNGFTSHVLAYNRNQARANSGTVKSALLLSKGQRFQLCEQRQIMTQNLLTERSKYNKFKNYLLCLSYYSTI